MIVQFYENEEKESIIKERQSAGLYLLRVEFLDEGNFLIFDDEPNNEKHLPTETELLQDYVMDVDFRLAMVELGFE